MAEPQTDWGTNVPLYDPEGKLRAVPQQSVNAALADPGTKRAIPMVTPQGEHRWVHEDELQDAIGQGGRISFPSQEIPKWFGFTPGNVASNIWQGAKGVVGGTYDLAKDLVNNPNWFEGSNSTYQKFVGKPAEEQVVRAGQELQAGHPIVAAGHVLASAIPMIGPYAAGLGEQAGRGDIGGAAGQAAGVYAGGKVMQKTPKVLNKLIPSSVRAGAGIAAIKAKIGDTVPDATMSVARANALADNIAANQPGVKLPPSVEGFIAKAQMSANPEAVAQAGAPPQPLTFNELHDSLQALNKELYVDRTVPNSMVPAVKTLAQSIADTLQQGAEQAGVGRDWNRMTKEYGRGQSMIRAGKKYGPAIGAGAGALAGSALGIPGLPQGMGALAPLAGEALGAGLGTRYGGSIAGTMVKGLVDRPGAGPPALPQTWQLPAPPVELLQPPIGEVARPVGAPGPAASTSAGGEAAAPAGRRAAREPVASEQRSGSERRTDAAARAKFAALTPEQQYQLAFTNKVTGMPNARALEASGPAPAYGMSDVAGLKWLNDTHGTAAGDALLKAKAQALRDAGLEAYHTGGDEFMMRGQNPVDLNNALVRANENLRNSVLEFRDAKTGLPEYYSGAEFRHGVGPSAEIAEQGMMSKKAAQKVTRGKQGTLRKVPPPPQEIASD